MPILILGDTSNSFKILSIFHYDISLLLSTILRHLWRIVEIFVTLGISRIVSFSGFFQRLSSRS